MASDDTPGYRPIEAVHPEWEGFLRLSTTDDGLTHETHGTKGHYRLDGPLLYVAWERLAAEVFQEIDGLFVHESLAPSFEAMSRIRKSSRSRQSPPIQVISLKRSRERRARFDRLNAGHDYAFFDAVDGSEIDLGQFIGGPQADAGIPYSAGAIGCALSHLALWRKADQENSVMTIVEDDAILHLDFPARSQAILQRLPADWDLIMWGWNFDAILSLHTMPGCAPMVVLSDQAGLRQAIRKFQASPVESHPYRLDKCFGTCGYSISPGGARKFQENCFPLRNIRVRFPRPDRMLPNNGIDVAMSRIYSATQSFVALPALIVTPNDNTASFTLGTQSVTP